MAELKEADQAAAATIVKGCCEDTKDVQIPIYHNWRQKHALASSEVLIFHIVTNLNILFEMRTMFIFVLFQFYVRFARIVCS